MADPLSKLRSEVQKLLRDVTTEGEQGFLSELPGHAPVTLEADKIVSDFYLAKLSEKVSRDLIASNERLAESSKRQAIALNWFTAGIFSVGVVEIVLSVIRWATAK